MDIKLYKTPGDFLRDNRAFLEKYEVPTQLNRNNAIAHMDVPCSPSLLFGRVEYEGGPVLFFGNTLPWNLCLNAAPGSRRAAEAARELAGYIRADNMEIAGVNARDGLCQAFIGAHGGDFALRSSMDIMVLEELIEPPLCQGLVRKAAAGDAELLAGWKLAFYKEALHEEPDIGALRERTQSQIESSAIWLMENQKGEPVSTAHTSRESGRGVSVSGVYTPPEHRGRGYCQSTVAALCRELLSSGKEYVTLFVDRKNPISNRVYRKIGFEVIEDCYDYRLC